MTTPTLLNPTPMTTLRKFEIGIFLVALVLGAICLRGWMDERGARNTAEASAQTQAAQATALGEQLAASKAEAAAYSVRMVQEAASVTTPQQAVKIITQYLPAPQAAPGAPAEAPTAIPVVHASDLDAAARAQLPAAPSYAVLTPDQTMAIAKDELACDADRHSLSACTQQLGDAQKIDALDKSQTATYKQALKGGTVLQRVGRVLKSAACGAAGATIAYAASRGSQVQYAAPAAGAAGGVIACSLF